MAIATSIKCWIVYRMLWFAVSMRELLRNPPAKVPRVLTCLFGCHLSSIIAREIARVSKESRFGLKSDPDKVRGQQIAHVAHEAETPRPGTHASWIPFVEGCVVSWPYRCLVGGHMRPLFSSNMLQCACTPPHLPSIQFN
jgi:hypothetical protein